MKRKTFLSIFALFSAITMALGQLPGSYSYDFRDGTIITNGQSDDGNLTLSGNYSLHGATYGLDMKVDGEINISVGQSSTLRFLGSKYSGLNLQGTTSNGDDLGTQDTKVINDLSDTYDFVYSGGADKLNFKTLTGSGNDLYLPTIEVIPEQAGGDNALTEAAKNIVYYFDLRDGSIIPNETTLNGNYTIEQGLFKIEPGSSHGYGYNGDVHGSILKEGNKITLKVAGSTYIKIGGCQYSNGTISASSTTGNVDVALQASQTSACYHVDSSSVDFLYVGTAGTVTLDFTGTTYIPIIEVVPVPYDVQLETYMVKSGSIQVSSTVSNTVINYTSGETATDNPTLTLNEGTVISATPDAASIRINLGGQPLSSFNTGWTGDIGSVTIQDDSLKITFTDQTTLPKGYVITVADNSADIHAEPGKTYTYSFADGSVLPQTSYTSLRYKTFVTNDGILTMNSNTDTESLQFGYHDSSHGAVFFPGNSMDMIVAGGATITFATCQYGSATDAIFEFTDAEGNVLGSTGAQNIGTGTCGTNSFSYAGAKGTITATLKSTDFPTAEVYIHGLTIENAPEVEPSNGKIDAWDFGAEQLDTATFNNNLTVDIINSWYAETITPGSSGNVLPSFSAGKLSWVGGGNDRLRTTNTSLTRYDENIASVTGYTGRVYVNAAANVGRYMSLALSEDDEVTLITKTDAGGTINFEYVADPESQTDAINITSDLTELKFVAKEPGVYHIFDTQGKPSYFRILRKDATYVTLIGTVDVSAAEGIPEGYAIVFKNEAGKTWTSTMSTNGYNVKLPVGYTYTLSLSDANGYIISNGNTLEVIAETTSHDVTIEKVELYTVTGAITGLGTEISNLGLVYTPDPAAEKIYKPEPVIDDEAATYSVQLEPSCRYTISATGVNDYYLVRDTLTIGHADASLDLAFEAKPLYKVTIETDGLTAEQLAKLGLTFTNLYEEGYSYSFSSIDNTELRDGVYFINYGGLDEYPVELSLTSNLKVDGATVTKTLAFQPIHAWSFSDKAISSGSTAYEGLLFTGIVASELAKGHLTAKPEATIKVPVKAGEKVKVTYYYSADFFFDDSVLHSTSSGSTSTLEYAEYVYTGTEAGYATITIGSGAGTTYITEISTSEIVEYQSVIHVGTDKEYQIINEALDAIGKMVRGESERVTVMIDPGNYEEMLVVSVPNVTLKNAAANPGIDLANKGVDIADNAVRITSYYGHGYNYYSMGTDQKWNADVLRVNKENGYLSYENKGSGTTNGSYWNATVVVSANGFEAEDIIFENSFNQYISKKESEDVVVMWESGSRGERPTDFGNTGVQHKSFVERGAAIAITNNTDKVVLDKCRVVGRQDSFYGGTGTRVVVYKGAMMGGTDYLFGGMTAVFYKSDLVMNTSDDNSDVSYLTAAQQSSGRGYLMYECTVTSATPNTETASTYHSKPGYFGRPWQASTSEVVFFNTTIDTSDITGYEGKSLINPVGWLNTLGGESSMMYEYGTIELSGENNQASRASWSTVLTEPTLTDGTEITTFNFTKGSDDWDPIPALIANDVNDVVSKPHSESTVQVYAIHDQIVVSNVQSNARVNVYSLNGSLVKTVETRGDIRFNVNKGFWIVSIITTEGQKAVKVVTY